MEVAFFRLIQEGVQNACRHGEAKEIQVKIEFKDDVIGLVVKDGGKGFDPKERKEDAFGMIGMRERVDLLGGDMTIDSKPGHGTLIMIQIPVQVEGDTT